MINKVLAPKTSALAETFIASAKKSIRPYESFQTGETLREFNLRHPLPKTVNPFDDIKETIYSLGADQSYALSHRAAGYRLDVMAG